MRDAEIRGEKAAPVKKEPIRPTRSEPRQAYVRPKYDKDEINLTHPLAQGSNVMPENIPPQAKKEVLPKKTTRRSYRTPLLIIAAITTLSATGLLGYHFIFNKNNPEKLQSNQSNSDSDYTIAFYTPKNLPKEYTYNNDVQLLKKDVYYYTVNGPNDTVFHVTQQLIPEGFDFTAFNKKFLSPDTFSSEAGTTTIGQAGSTFLASIRTNKNTWIIVNAPTITSPTVLEAVSRSLAL